MHRVPFLDGEAWVGITSTDPDMTIVLWHNGSTSYSLQTELTDLTSARFLIKAVRLLARTHLLLIVLLRDEELEAFAFREPANAQDVTRAITAASLLKERQVVVAELRQLGVDLVEAQHEQVPVQIAEAYLQIKRRDRL